jgi:hypothetical protein
MFLFISAASFAAIKRPNRHLFAASLLFLTCSTLSAGSPTAQTSQQPQFVYVSASHSAKCYHATSDCWSLKCSSSINKIPLSKAAASKRPCRICRPAALPTKKQASRKVKPTPKPRDYFTAAENE